MKLNLKLITSSFTLALTLVAPQVTHSSSPVDNSNIAELAAAPAQARPPIAPCPLPTDVEKTQFTRGWGSIANGDGGMARDVLRNILTLLANDGETKPGDLRLVCKTWQETIDMSIHRDKDDKFNKQNIFYADLPRIWQRIVQTAYGGLEHKDTYDMFANARLIYHPNEDKEGVLLPFSDMKNPFNGTFNLSECYYIADQIRFTTSVEEFFKIGGENKDKLVVLAIPYAVFKNLYADKFSGIIEKWNPSIAPVGLIWRYGNWKDLSWYDYLVTSPAGELSRVNLYENWKKSGVSRCWTYDYLLTRSIHFTLHF